MPCWYCEGKLTRPGPRARETDASREHLTPLTSGGTDHFSNRVVACRRCNSFVDRWPRTLKEEFRRMMRESKGGPDPRDRPRLAVERELQLRVHERHVGGAPGRKP